MTLLCIGWFGGYTYLSLDTAFNFINYARVPNQLSQAYGLKWDTDTSFYMAGEWGGSSGDDLGLIRQYHPLDTTSSIFNSWGTEGVYDYPAPNGAIDYRNKDSIFIGGISPFQPGLWGTHPSVYVLFQTDSLLNTR